MIEGNTKISNYIIHNFQKFVYKYFANKQRKFQFVFIPFLVSLL